MRLSSLAARPFLPRTFPGVLSLSLLCALAFPLSVVAQHFGNAHIDVRLVGADSVLVEVSADREDFYNTVQAFPDVHKGTLDSFVALYQQRMEVYLQSRVHLRADGKAVRLAAVRWKPGGQGREDALDSASLRVPFHAITLGGRLPASPKVLTVRADLWVERPDRPRITMVEYAFFEGDYALRRQWTPTERTVRFPLTSDSLEVMRKTPPLPATIRVPVDHAGHGH